MISPHFEKTFEGWRDVARVYLDTAVPPEEIHWNEKHQSLFNEQPITPPSARIKKTVPKEFIPLAESIAYSRHEDRWDLLYRILYRLQYENPHLLNIIVDLDIHRAQLIKKSVRRDIHKMHAFVRFKKIETENGDMYVAWHKPEHLIVRPATPFFARRFGDKPWSIFTPNESAHWDLKKLTFGPGIEQNQFAAEDNWDDVWKTYYKSIFNPARIKIKAMKTEMAPKYWASMPETALIPELIRSAPAHLQEMARSQNHAATVDPSWSLQELQDQSRVCKACPLFADATQTVVGVGPENASLMIVGEAPGDNEDLAGIPFIGPAGEILNEELLLTGFRREDVYLTNAVKHFKWEKSGERRLHKKPTGREMTACKPWLEAEIRRVRPKLILALGTTAGTAVLGKLPKITTERGQIFTHLSIAPKVLLSWHPSAILRATSDQEKTERRLQLRADLTLAFTQLANNDLRPSQS